jgi:hypothetical protein
VAAKSRYSLQECGEKSAAPGQIGHSNVFVRRVRTIPLRAETI